MPGSSRVPAALRAAALCALVSAALSLRAQYPGQLSHSDPAQPVLRSIAVLEWTGDLAHPIASRLVPVSLFDDGALQDGSLYLARPVPFALRGEVEYEVQRSGEALRLFDVRSSGREMGGWVGHGMVKPLPVSAPKDAEHTPIEDEKSERPVLHKKQEEPGHPVLKKRADAEDGTVSAPAAADPDRPRLQRGVPGNVGPQLTPTLMGLPEDLHQAVAVSDAVTRTEHSWDSIWSDRSALARLRSQLQEAAREAAGVTPPAAQTPKDPAALIDEKLHSFELGYNGGVTLVYSASSDEPAEKQKFITLIAQTDLYGNLQILLRQVGRRSHLDESPMLRLVDAVDAMGDNHAELLFEVRGATQRRFSLYRVQRGRAEELFVGSEYLFGSENP